MISFGDYMICELYIKDFALIDEVRIQFSEGFNVITGETGSGKSIMIDAISLILGKKASKMVVKKGRERAIIEALFSCENKDIKDYLDSIGIEIKEKEEIILTREITSDGRSVCRINGRSITVNDLRYISTKLISIHGQNEYEELSNSEKQLALLDRFGEKDLLDNLNEYKDKFSKMQKVLSELNKLNENMDDSAILRELDFLSYEIEEINKAKIKKDEDIEIKEHLKIVENSVFINENKDKIHYNLYEKDNSILSMLYKIISYTEDIIEFVPESTSWLKVLNDAYYNLEDLANEITSGEQFEYEESEIDKLYERLNLINEIYKRYGNSYEAVIKYKEKCVNRKNEILSREEKNKELNEKMLKYESVLYDLAKSLSNSRKKIAEDISCKIIQELDSLNMKNVQLNFEFTNSKISKNGTDNVELKVSFNKGEDLKSLNKVASGGEMSRFMLALKNIMAKYDDINSIIFDEIDTGVSGLAAEVIGSKLKSISKYRQVICVSHLPQVASFANAHFSVFKESDDNNTKTFVNKLDEKQRILEIAKMMAGSSVTDETIVVVKDMIKKNMVI